MNFFFKYSIVVFLRQIKVMAVFILGVPLRIFAEKSIAAKHSREQFSTIY